ncbi:Crp/Fnr family transcriptional regulator [Pseudoflavonifractor sp. 524-17]|uniref:Crp/Fnr family transcriptional regulator n=1 Tax=Pseudoflavonifractor sp. 524-17 TaxID=2304577 RepID=UPI00137A4BBE|nr:Crp/Fnr family transcriptional regulator [Pseudoflavonifractor sp. 524-17]NCE64794.1 Crp/Fnr family transcriptional regulator [Pseudoflavonifractor sp. 524-17]
MVTRKTALEKGNAQARALLAHIPDRILEVSRLLEIKAGTRLVSRGEPVALAYLLLSGELHAFYEAEEGACSTWLVMTAPTGISDLELLAGEERYSMNVRAATDSVLLYCTVEEFRRELRQNNRLLWEMAALFAKKSCRLVETKGLSAFSSGLEKVGRYLILYCGAHPPIPGQDVVVRYTRPAIASNLGISTRTVDRYLKQLEEAGLVTLHGKIHISLAQYKALAARWEPQE